ncbi:response regulator transcription factor [Haloferax profundi]|uniref:Response regulatory domain-containing protein n=1 Tax=Haloferax profundi TaxID=1544718 RepID=A0A0W1RE98_9EURY|nr:response regulator [Haloferax profundi]KTG11726.1 hypothetical protein AUR66_19910 [Haloferax profundi]
MNPPLLIVEDDDDMRDIVQTSLSSYEVVAVDNGEAAWDYLSSGTNPTPRAVVLDVMMPKLDGFATLEKIRATEEFASLPVVMLTSRGREDDVLRALELDATDFVTKPFKPFELRARIERVLAKGDEL